MLGWLKAFPIGHYIIMAAIGVAMWMYSDLTLTKQALDNETRLRQQWEHAAVVQQDIGRRDTVIIRAGEDAERAIQEAPNANTPVPSDVAVPWANGIDSVRDAGAKPADTEHDLPGLSGGEAERDGPNNFGIGAIFNRSGTSFLEM